MAEIEIGGGNGLPIPANFVSLRQLRDRRLMEAQVEAQAQTQPQNPPLDLSSVEEKSDERLFLFSLDRSFTEKRSEKRSFIPRHDRRFLKEKSDKRPFLPPNYVSRSQLQERHLKVKRGKEREKEDVEKEKDIEKEKEEEEEEGGNHSLLPPNYVSLRQLRELRLKEKEEKEKKEPEEKADKDRLLEIKEQEKGDEAGQIEVEINKKTGNVSRNPQPKKPSKLGHMKSARVWQPVLRPAGTGSGTSAMSADALLIPETGASGEFGVSFSDQTGDAEMKKKSKKKNKKNERNRKRTTGKKAEVGKGSERGREVTGPKIGEVVTASEAMAAVSGSQIEDNAVKNGKGQKDNATESSGRSIPACGEAKGLDEQQAVGFIIRSSRDKGKSEEVNLKEPSDNVVPLSVMAEGSHGEQEVIGSKIVNIGEMKGKGKSKIVNLPELSDQASIVREVKGFNGAGEVVGSEIESSKHEKGKGENVNVPESSKGIAAVGGDGRRKWTAGVRSRRGPMAGRFAWRSEHLRDRGMVWVPKAQIPASF